MHIDMTIIWLAVLVVLLIVEIQTMALTTVWFAGGSLAAIVAVKCGANLAVQITVFLTVSLVVLFLLRPRVVKKFNVKREKTNADGLIGKQAKVTQTVNNKENTGQAIINGQEWTARAEDNDEIIEVDTWVKIVDIKGVKLILSKNKEEK